MRRSVLLLVASVLAVTAAAVGAGPTSYAATKGATGSAGDGSGQQRAVVTRGVKHVPVPVAGRAVDTSHPDHVVGSGTPASCTSRRVVRAVAQGGVITFDCGADPVVICVPLAPHRALTVHEGRRRRASRLPHLRAR